MLRSFMLKRVFTCMMMVLDIGYWILRWSLELDTGLIMPLRYEISGAFYCCITETSRGHSITIRCGWFAHGRFDTA